MSHWLSCPQNMFNIWNHVASLCHGLLHFVSKRDRGPLNTESDQLAFKNKVYFYFVSCCLKDGATLGACIQIPTAIRTCIYFIGPARYNGNKIKRSKIRSAFIKRSDSGPKQQHALCILCITLAPLPFTIDPQLLKIINPFLRQNLNYSTGQISPLPLPPIFFKNISVMETFAWQLAKCF
jgi:hypothetical protein